MVQKAINFVGHEPPLSLLFTSKPYGVDNIGIDNARYIGGSK